MPDFHHDFEDLNRRKHKARAELHQRAATAYAQWEGNPELQEAAAAALVHTDSEGYFWSTFRRAAREAEKKRRKDAKRGHVPSPFADDERLRLERTLYVR